jgi:hypothetical protein
VIDGLTHASRVIALVRSSEFESGTFTRADVPLKNNALPNLPAVDQVAFDRVPVLLLPERSAVVVPVPSSKPYAAASPVDGACTVAVAWFDAPPTFPAASSAVTL